MLKTNCHASTLDTNSYLIRHEHGTEIMFGPIVGPSRWRGVVDHIEKEVDEVHACRGQDPAEWIDICILAIDGFLREGNNRSDFPSIEGKLLPAAIITAGSIILPAALAHTTPLLQVTHLLRELMICVERFPRFWVGIVYWAIVGYALCGHQPEEFMMQLFAKQRRNFNREWPDWREASPDKAICHVKRP